MTLRKDPGLLGSPRGRAQSATRTRPDPAKRSRIAPSKGEARLDDRSLNARVSTEASSRGAKRRGDPEVVGRRRRPLDCFAALAMTGFVCITTSPALTLRRAAGRSPSAIIAPPGRNGFRLPQAAEWRRLTVRTAAVRRHAKQRDKLTRSERRNHKPGRRRPDDACESRSHPLTPGRPGGDGLVRPLPNAGGAREPRPRLLPAPGLASRDRRQRQRPGRNERVGRLADGRLRGQRRDERRIERGGGKRETRLLLVRVDRRCALPVDPIQDLHWGDTVRQPVRRRRHRHARQMGGRLRERHAGREGGQSGTAARYRSTAISILSTSDRRGTRAESR